MAALTPTFSPKEKNMAKWEEGGKRQKVSAFSGHPPLSHSRQENMAEEEEEEEKEGKGRGGD